MTLLSFQFKQYYNIVASNDCRLANIRLEMAGDRIFKRIIISIFKNTDKKEELGDDANYSACREQVNK